MSTIRFEREDVDLFVIASHDRNPLHVSSQYARKTMFGDPVVFGVLAVLKALGGVTDCSPLELDSITIIFRNPMFLGVAYSLEVQAGKSGQIKVKISDVGKAMLTATLAYRAESSHAVGSTASTAARQEAATWRESDLRPGLVAEGDYAPEPTSFRKLLARCGLAETGNAASPLSVLMLASYLVGMELPGERALFSKLKAQFQVASSDAVGPISYRAAVSSFHDEFGVLETSVKLSTEGIPYAELELSALVRPESPLLNLARLTSALPVSEALRGKTALVIGGSRGLGASIVVALASQGCDVFLNFLSSRTEAEGLARLLPHEWGKVSLVQGDATDLSWCQEMQSRLADRGGLDVLVCSAVPSLRTLPFGLDSIDRVRKFLDISIAMTATPLAAFSSQLESRRGTAVIVSTIYAAETYDKLPADLHHYVASKRAVEGLVRSLSAWAGQTRYLVARPPRLLTDQTNTVMARLDSLPVEQAAAAIVLRLISSGNLDRYVLLEDFSDNSNTFPESSKH